MSIKPKVSAIIPVRNGAAFIRQAIGSILEQSYPCEEIIVVDDGSTDETASILAELSHSTPNLQFVSQTPQGASQARNHGVQLSKSEYVAFLDADDLWLPQKLNRQVQLILSHSDVDLVFTHMVQFIDAESEDFRNQVSVDTQNLPGFSPTTLFIRRADFLRVGEFDQEFRLGEFIDWYCRAQEIGLRWAMIPEVLARRRVHPGNTGMRDRDKRPDYARVLRAALLRRRQTATFEMTK